MAAMIRVLNKIISPHLSHVVLLHLCSKFKLENANCKKKNKAHPA